MTTEINPLPYCTPESVGISSSDILRYLRALADQKLNLHSFAIIRHGKIAAEGAYAPFRIENLHRLYSTSKSLVSIGIGLLQDEGKLSIHDRIADYFPDKCPVELHPFIAEATIRDLLRMATPFRFTTYKTISNPEHDWVKTFFEAEPNHKPGQVFNYDTSATTTLCALVERLSGMTLADYLRSKMPCMGLSPEAFCIKVPNGEFSWGGSGFLCTLHDLAKIALMTLNYGEYNGERIVSETYMREATSAQIDNGKFGYGYQIWRHRYGFAFHGAGGQLALMFPDQDMILVTMADCSVTGYDGIIQLFYDHILNSLKETKPENPEDWAELLEYFQQLSVPVEKGGQQSDYTALADGKTYTMYYNERSPQMQLKWRTLHFDFNPNQKEGTMTYTDAEGEKTLRFGFGHFVQQNFPGFATEEEMNRQGNLIYGFDRKDVKTYMPCMISAAWKSDHELSLLCYSVGTYLGTLRMRIAFEDRFVTVISQAFCENYWMDLQGFQSGECC